MAAAYDKYGTSHSPSAGTPSSGFVWDGWYSSDTLDADPEDCTTLVSTNTSINFTTGLQDKTYYAKYTDNNHTLTVTPPSGTEGTVTVYVGDTVEDLAEVTPDGSGHVTVIEDQYVRVVAAPTATYKFSDWETTGIAPSPDATYTFLMPASDATVTADFALKSLYTIAWRTRDASAPTDDTPNPATLAGCTTEFVGYGTSDQPITTGPDKWYEGNHSVSGSAGTGWRIVAWLILDAATETELYRIDTPLPLDTTFEFSTTSNVIIQCNFYKIPVTVNALVHTASNKTGVYAEVSFDGVTGETLTVDYGDTVTFGAGVGDYTFGGWYNGAGTLLSSNLAYSVAILADTDVYLKVKGTVLLAATAAVGASGTVSIDAGTAGATATKDVTLGATCTILSAPAGNSSFECWFETGDTFEDPIPGYDASQVITVTDHVNLSSYVVLTSSVTPRYLAVLVFDNATGLANGVLGTVAAALGAGGTEISQGDWETDTGCTAPLDGDVSANHKYYKFTGTRSTAITATAADGVNAPFLWWYRNKLLGTLPSQTISGVAEPLGTANPYTLVTTSGYVVKAYFGVPANVDVSCGYCTGSDPTIGEISMEPITADRSAVGDTLVDIYPQGTEVTFSTDVANGYMFDGWYSAVGGLEADLVSMDMAYVTTIVLPITLFAKFVLDDHAIYKWEGGVTNKTLTWRSKRYMSSKPFSLSSARVYADTYPLALNVYVSSSPNAPSPTTPSATVTIADETPRRLASIRREKYVEIEAVATGDVTQMAVAGSMEGLIP